MLCLKCKQKPLDNVIIWIQSECTNCTVETNLFAIICVVVDNQNSKQITEAELPHEVYCSLFYVSRCVFTKSIYLGNNQGLEANVITSKLQCIAVNRNVKA